LDGVDCVPSACRRKWSTIVTGETALIDMLPPEGTVISVSMMTICMGTPSRARAACGDPNAEKGSVTLVAAAAPQRGHGAQKSVRRR